MTSDATDNTMRAEFEAYYSGVHKCMSLEQSFGGFYTEWQVQVCWQAWQAARADTARQQAQAEVERMKAEVSRLKGFEKRYEAVCSDTARQVDEAVAAEREAIIKECIGHHDQLRPQPWNHALLLMKCVIRDRARSTRPTDASQYSKPDRAPSEDGYPYG